MSASKNFGNVTPSEENLGHSSDDNSDSEEANYGNLTPNGGVIGYSIADTFGDEEKDCGNLTLSTEAICDSIVGTFDADEKSGSNLTPNKKAIGDSLAGTFDDEGQSYDNLTPSEESVGYTLAGTFDNEEKNDGNLNQSETENESASSDIISKMGINEVPMYEAVTTQNGSFQFVPSQNSTLSAISRVGLHAQPEKEKKLVPSKEKLFATQEIQDKAFELYNKLLKGDFSEQEVKTASLLPDTVENVKICILAGSESEKIKALTEIFSEKNKNSHLAIFFANSKQYVELNKLWQAHKKDKAHHAGDAKLFSKSGKADEEIMVGLSTVSNSI